VKIAAKPDDIHAIRVAAGEADLVLGCDLVVSGSKKVLAAVRKDETGVVVNTAEVYPGDFTRNADFSLPTERIKKAIRDAAGNDVHFVEAGQIATALLGNSIAANMFMLGFAYQRGFVPLAEASILRAIELNGEAVAMNQAAFQWGRRAAADAAGIAALVAPLTHTTADRDMSETLESVIARRVAFLTAYQNKAYAQRYADLVTAVHLREEAVVPGKADLTDAVARYFFKLMAVKDEYEVARLYTDGSFAKQLAATFDGDLKLEFNLAPPILGRKDAKGEPVKTTFGPWMLKVFKLLAAMKGLRGTPFDIFGLPQERKTERKLIVDYESLMAEILAKLTAENHALAGALARIPEKIRGYGHVKMHHLHAAKAEEAQLLAQFRAGPAPMQIAAE
jgi:indolepyruvate ferredoxin oxidoreductase